jgi:hypothetical protein
LKPVIIEKVEVVDPTGAARTTNPAPVATPVAVPTQDGILSPK